MNYTLKIFYIIIDDIGCKRKDYLKYNINNYFWLKFFSYRQTQFFGNYGILINKRLFFQ